MLQENVFMYCIYKHTSPSGKSYIGLTQNYEERCIGHQKSSSGCRAFYAAIQKYGWDNFIHEILYNGLTLQMALYREQQCINEYGSIVPHGYNLTTGGDFVTPSAETRALISAANKGKSLTIEHKQRISLAHRGKIGIPHTEETKVKMSLARKGVPSTRVGYTHTTDTKLKIRASLLNRTPLTEDDILRWCKRFIITSPTGDVYDIKNLNKFCRDHGLTNSNMTYVAKGKYKHHKGWLCRYADLTDE